MRHNVAHGLATLVWQVMQNIGLSKMIISISTVVNDVINARYA